MAPRTVRVSNLGSERTISSNAPTSIETVTYALWDEILEAEKVIGGHSTEVHEEIVNLKKAVSEHLQFSRDTDKMVRSRSAP